MNFDPTKDVCLPDDASVCHVWQQPSRWDEYLDLKIPLFLHHTCQSWTELLEALELSGLNPETKAHLVDRWGAVSQASPELAPEAPWCLILNWSHPEQGWRARLPLSGRSFVVTREKEQGRGFVEQLEELGALVHHIPTIQFESPTDPSILKSALSGLSAYHWLLFTSVNGVEWFFWSLEEAKLDHRSLGHCRFGCIGPKTAEALKSQGFRCDLLPDSYVAEGLLEALQTELGEGIKDLKILIPRAEVAREILPHTLREWGADVLVAPVYQTTHPKPEQQLLDALPSNTQLIFTSSSTVKQWVDLTSRTDLECYCIGPVTAGTAQELGIKIAGTAKTHTIDGLVALLQESTKAPQS